MTKPHSLMGNSSSKVISPTPTPDAVPGDANSTNITLEKYQKEPKYHEQEVQSLLQPTDEDNECPEASSSSLSAMEIHNLIKSKRFTEAHQSLLSTRQEILRDLEENCHKNPSNDLHKKKTDIKLLYEALRDEMMSIIRDSNSEQSCNTELLVSVVRIIQEEEKREKDPGSGEWSWRDTWKEAVLEGVKAKIKSVHLDSKEQNKSWLAVHLGQLGRVVVEDLENVKNRLTGCYPPSFDVFNTYVDSYHQAIAQHIRDISQKELETKDSYALLKWILNDYKSEKLMGSPTLQPEMNDNIVALPLEEDFLDRIKDYYYCQIRKDFMSIIAKLIETEQGIIHNQMEPEILLDVYHSDIHCHICQALYSEISTAQEINAELEENVLCICLEELQTFPER